MIIRSQLKTFLRQLDFHKGAYFLTADKSNAALARAEGLCPIYVRPPSKTPRIRWREGDGWKQREEMRMRVPIGKLVYDMAVEFRPLTIRRGDQDIKVKCDPKGEMIDHWVHKNLEIEREGLERLQGDYQGKFGLRRVRRTWRRLTRELVGWEE
jgi:hypothetical protein